MRIGELQTPIDVYELAIREAQKFLNNNPHIITESAYDNKEYRHKIDTEKQYTISPTALSINHLYFPLQILGIPVGQYISVRTSDNVQFIKQHNDKLFFRTSTMRDIVFPANDTEIGDQCTDILIYDNVDDRDQFLSMMKLSFIDWHFIVNKD